MSIKSTTLNLFATKDDLLAVLKYVEIKTQVKYVQAGLFETPERPVFNISSQLPDLGTAIFGDTNQETAYLVSLLETPLKVRRVPQRSGEVRYAVDQLENPETVVLRPGGKYDNSTLISGIIGNINNEIGTHELMILLSDAIKRLFVKVKSYRLGPEAKKMLDAGARLTSNVSAPREYDLRK